MMMHKIGDVIVNNTDNLLISSFVGIASVGCYSNYYLLIGSVQQVLTKPFRELRQCRQSRCNGFQRAGADDFFFRLFTQPLAV